MANEFKIHNGAVVNGPVTATTYYGDGSNLTGVSGGGGTFTGGTVTGDTNFTGQLQVGNLGFEGTGININGLTFDSSFKVSDIDGTNYAQTILHRHSTVLEPLIVGARSNSDDSGHTGVTLNMNTFTIYGAGWNSNAYNLNGQLSIATDDAGTLSSTSSPGKISLYTTPNGSIWPELAVKIDSNKNMRVYGGLSASTINLTTTTTGATHQNLGLNADGRITRIGNSSNETFVYSFANNADNLDFYDDGLVRFGWDAPGNDLEFYMDTEPAGASDIRCLATFNYGTQQNTFITTVGVLYDIYGAGVPAGSQLTAIIVAETDPTYPIYQVDLYNASSNVTVKITKTKLI